MFRSHYTPHKHMLLMYRPHYTALFVLLGLAVCSMSLVMWQHVRAATYLTRVSDLISMSAPATTTNQTITFTLAQAIPANGAIELYFNEGGFTIPSALNYTDVDVGFSASAGGPYTQRPLSFIQTAGTDDVTVTSGSAGMLRIDLNTSVGIPAGDEVQVKIGTNASYGAIGDQQMSTTNATGTYPVTIYTYDASDNELDYGRTVIVVIQQVAVGPVDTTDTTPPSVVYAEPTGILQVGTRGVELLVVTDEISECKYATSSMSYDSMPYGLYGTTTGLTFYHFAQETGLTDDTHYDYYVRCIDYRLNEMDPDYLLSFDIGVAPGSASSTSTTTGTGTGTGTGSTTASSTCTGTDCNGTGTGSGGGPSGSGSGNGPKGGDSSGSGGGGGTSGTGTQLPQADVRIDGWAYPGATVAFLRDGIVVATNGAGSDGAFSNFTEGLDRGSYTFSTYAVDSTGVRSATFSTTLWLRSDTLNVLANVMLPPTIRVTEDSVQPGTSLAVSGYTTPNASVTTWLRPYLAAVSASDSISTTTATSNGAWSLRVPTDGLTQGTYELVAQAVMPDGTVESDKSARKPIGIGVPLSTSGDCSSTGDLNCDGFVNLVDFSILVFNWNSTGGVADINQDGIVSLPDFSILLYYWTG